MISLENVTKEYDLPTGKAGQLVAADHLTLEVPAGEVLGFAIFLNVVFAAFYWWGNRTPIESQATVLMLNVVVFFCLGLAAIRNRERLRRILRTRESGMPSMLDLNDWRIEFAGNRACGNACPRSNLATED